jgi:Domain of unknown function (DUF222)
VADTVPGPVGGTPGTGFVVLHILHRSGEGDVGDAWFDVGMFPPEPTPPDTPPGDAAANPEAFAGMIDAVKMFETFTRWAAACRAEAIDRARLWAETADLSVPTTGGPHWSAQVAGRRVLVTELACALRISERAAENLVAESEALVHDLPVTRDALRGGRIGYRHAQVVIDHTATLPRAGVAAVEEAVLPKAESLTVPKLDRAVRDLRERLHPESVTDRHITSVADRHIETCPAKDGMAWMNAFLPAAEVTGIANRLRDIADQLKGEPGEDRTRTQLIADAFTDLLLDGTTTAVTPGTGATGEAVEGKPTRRIEAPIGTGIRWLSPSGHEYETDPATHIRPPKSKRFQAYGSVAPMPDDPPF